MTTQPQRCLTALHAGILGISVQFLVDNASRREGGVHTDLGGVEAARVLLRSCSRRRLSQVNRRVVAAGIGSYYLANVNLSMDRAEVDEDVNG